MQKKINECITSNICGACSILNIPYKEQLDMKTKMLKELLGENEIIYNTIGMTNPYGYRNKAKYVFGIKKSKNVMGFFEEGSHKIVANEKCMIHNEIANDIAQYIFKLVNKYKVSIYNEDNNTGVLRHCIIKVGINTNEVMIILVTTNKRLGRQKDIVNDIIKKYTNVKTIVQNINEKRTSAILGDKNIKLYGNGYIYDTLGKYKFKISPLSFYQVNPIQTEKLYNIAIELANLKGNEIVYDLYCGIGTISLFVSEYVGRVYGVESVKDAVKDANENKKINNVKNVEFLVGRVEYILPKLFEQTKRADAIFVDPPRIGLDDKTIQTILKIMPNKIIYISCNPETLARDIKLLNDKYILKKVQPVDMFPHTKHVETIALLCRE